MRFFRGLAGVFALVCLTAASCSAYAGELPFFSIFPRIRQHDWYISSGWANGPHQSCEWRAELIHGDSNRLVLTLSGKHRGHVRPIGCAEIRTTALYGYGRYEARMKTAAGSGLNTAFFTYIGPPLGAPEHDEIDVEFLGKNPRLVQLGFWRDGTNHDAKVVDLGYDASAAFHTYAFDWYPDKIVWYADGREIHRTAADSPIAINKGHLFFSLWSAGKGSTDWLGPFRYKSPVSAEIEWTRYSPHEEDANAPQ